MVIYGGKNGEVVGTSTSSTSEKVYPVAGNYRELTDHYNELSLKFKDGYSVIFRMYNEGMAYRFCGNLPEQDSLIVVDEEAFLIWLMIRQLFYLKQLILQLGS